MTEIRSIIYIFLPCRPVYPLGVTYLADAVHRKYPDLRQQILDLSQIPPAQRRGEFLSRLQQFDPDLVCFSWRDIQVFAPHEGDPSLKYAFNFYYSYNPWKKLVASVRGLGYLWTYYRGIRDILGYFRTVHLRFPGKRLMVGGGAFSVFADQLILRLPEGTIGVVGEGEDALLKLIEGKDLSDERTVIRKGTQVFHGSKTTSPPVQDQAIDLPYLTSIFPQHVAYKNDCVGVQSKRGCPYDCQFCEYPYIEGKRVRYRAPERVLQDILQHYRLWGTRNFWFTDAQFITGSEALPQCAEILERIISEKLDLTWSGYVRTSLITPELADLMVRSGVGDLEVAITSGSQAVLNELHMGFRLENLYDGCRYLKEAGFKGKLILNYSLNSPGDTEVTLLESVASYKKIAAILGEDRVFPMLFFLGVQPHTGFEQRLIQEGYLSSDYNPLSLNPATIGKMLYNPPPLSGLIARACLKAWDKTAWEMASPTGRSVRELYADESLFRGVVENAGREVLLNLEQDLLARGVGNEQIRS
ncbi:MAG TPA: radical SAM protein [Nitrospiria bacterium]